MSRGPQNVIIPCDIGDTVYKVNHKKKDISHWYVYELRKDEEKGWYALAKNNKNKYKFTSIEIPFSDFGEKVFSYRPEAEQALEEASVAIDTPITFKCGHTEVIPLTGTAKYRFHTKSWREKQLCPICRNAKSEKEGRELVEMKYKDYIKKFKGCDTKVGSFNEESKTIMVYLPKDTSK